MASSEEGDVQPQQQTEHPKMSAAERRRRKILARGTSRIDQITGSFQKTTGKEYDSNLGVLFLLSVW